MPSHTDRPLVLLVEDSEDDAFFFRWTLQKSGLVCDVVHVADGVAAIQRIDDGLQGRNGARLPDLVFLDLKIPNYSGFDVLKWIGERGIKPPLNVAVLSGSDQPGDMQRAEALGASDYYVKPLSVEQLTGRFAAWRKSRAPLTEETALASARIA